MSAQSRTWWITCSLGLDHLTYCSSKNRVNLWIVTLTRWYSKQAWNWRDSILVGSTPIRWGLEGRLNWLPTAYLIMWLSMLGVFHRTPTGNTFVSTHVVCDAFSRCWLRWCLGLPASSVWVFSPGLSLHSRASLVIKNFILFHTYMYICELKQKIFSLRCCLN